MNTERESAKHIVSKKRSTEDEVGEKNKRVRTNSRYLRMRLRLKRWKLKRKTKEEGENEALGGMLHTQGDSNWKSWCWKLYMNSHTSAELDGGSSRTVARCQECLFCCQFLPFSLGFPCEQEREQRKGGVRTQNEILVKNLLICQFLHFFANIFTALDN